MTINALAFVFVIALATATVAPAFARQQSPAAPQTPAEQKAQEEADLQRQLQFQKNLAEEAERRAQRSREEDQKRLKEEQAAINARWRVIPLNVQVVISRYQGDKRVSSLPYALAINANALHPVNGGQGAKPAQLRMGAKVPVPTAATAVGPGQPITSFNYQDIGTSIDGSAFTTDDSRFKVNISIEETSVYADEQTAGTPRATGMPVFRTFRSTNELLLKDGQTGQYTAATDRVSGEIIRIDVTVNVVK